MRVVVLMAAVLAPLAVPPAAHAGWMEPISDSEVTAPFDYSERTPFLAGQRRGVDLLVSQQTVVRAVCGGVVRHAGALPSGRLGVSIDCGGLTATELGLARVAATSGRTVSAGAVVGTVAAGATLRLGARRSDSRWGYVDPMRLIGPERGPIPVATIGTPRVTRRVMSPQQAKYAGLRNTPAPALAPALGPQIGLGLGATAILAALLIPARRRRPDSLRPQHGLLRHYADLLRQRRAAPWARVHDDRRRRARSPSPSAWRGRLLPHRHR